MYEYFQFSGLLVPSGLLCMRVWVCMCMCTCVFVYAKGLFRASCPFRHVACVSVSLAPLSGLLIPSGIVSVCDIKSILKESKNVF